MLSCLELPQAVRHQSSRSSRCTLIKKHPFATPDGIAASLVEDLAVVLKTEDVRGLETSWPSEPVARDTLKERRVCHPGDPGATFATRRSTAIDGTSCS